MILAFVALSRSPPGRVFDPTIGNRVYGEMYLHDQRVICTI